MTLPMILDLDAWKAARLAALTADDGWLNLTDRIALVIGAQTVGRAAGNAVIIRSGPDHLGTLTLTDQGGWLCLPDGADLPFVAKPETPPQLHAAGLLLELHSDNGETALRVRDLALPRDVQLRYYPADPAWIIRADWLVLPKPQSQVIDQKGGAPTTVALTHVARFHRADQDVTLLATHWKAGRPMFVIRDATSGHQTYIASRFLIGENAGDSQITLDFNRAFTPPCGFSEFAICPLPPRSNILPFAVQAGEMWP